MRSRNFNNKKKQTALIKHSTLISDSKLFDHADESLYDEFIETSLQIKYFSQLLPQIHQLDPNLTQ